MAPSSPPSPGHALNDYTGAVELMLDQLAHGKISWMELLDLQLAASARLHGRLLDHFLQRAHARQSLTERSVATGNRDGA